MPETDLTAHPPVDSNEPADLGSGRRTPTIADPFADLLIVLSERQRQAIVLRLSIGFYDGWHPDRNEIADLVAVELGWLTVEDMWTRRRQRTSGQTVPDYIPRILATLPHRIRASHRPH